MVAVLQQGVIVKSRIGALADVVLTDLFSVNDASEDCLSARRQRDYLEGQILHSVGEHQWLIDFEDGVQRQCHSNQLSFVYDPMFDIGGEENRLEQDNDMVINSNDMENESFEREADNSIISNNLNMNNIDNNEFEQEEEIDEDEIEETIEGRLDEDHDEAMGFDAVFDGSYAQYETKRRAAEIEKQRYIQENLSFTKKQAATRTTMTWNIVNESLPTLLTSEYDNVGVRCVDWSNFVQLKQQIKNQSSKKRKCTMSSPKSKRSDTCQPFLDLFLCLWPGDWKQQVEQLNLMIQKDYINKQKNGKNPKKLNLLLQTSFLSSWVLS